ncbi:TolC family protein [Polaribacter cellanae]|uniref:TolC family protein n=1 Tax=Polaribacter cellanae TaxID=2818493 RepID=A0A975CPV3_9FLAO|nr:TolC family protein [Polaribacter cellanae]QTE23299.1 TolC family protein [Polaribacter cellanae]
MKYKFLLFNLILFFGISKTFGQATIPVDIVKLSEITLAKNPTIKRNLLSVTNAEGSLQIQESAFDYQLISALSLGRNSLNLFEVDPRNEFITDQLKSKNTGVSVGLQKAFRSSLRANISVDYTNANDNFPFNRFNQDVGAYFQDHTVSSTFSLTQPLLRGRGNGIATALERASQLNLESTNENVEFANSFELSQMGAFYWQYVAAYKRLKIFKENEARVRRVLEITQELVKADKRPAGDLAQVQADLANQERQTKVAEQTLYATKLNLGRSIGLSEEESKQLGNPTDGFPTIVESGYTKNINKAMFINIAQNNRKDIFASKKSQEALELQLSLSENNKKPQLDLTGFVNYGGATMGNGLGRALETFSQKEGSNIGYGISLNLTFPINNNLAKGTYIQNEVALKDQQIANDNLQRNIDLNVSIALNNLENSVQVLEKAQQSLNFYQEVYNNEQIKFKNGLTILLNLIQFQERLTFAELEYLQAHQQFASAIINLRYETGTLLVANKNGLAGISKDLFYTIPK